MAKLAMIDKGSVDGSRPAAEPVPVEPPDVTARPEPARVRGIIEES